MTSDYRAHLSSSSSSPDTVTTELTCPGLSQPPERIVGSIDLTQRERGERASERVSERKRERRERERERERERDVAEILKSERPSTFTKKATVERTC